MAQRPRASKLPLSAFDPRYKELLLMGGREAFDLPCPTPADARNLRARIHTFRSKSRDANAPDWELLYHCKLMVASIMPDAKGNTAVLRFTPRNAEFDAILTAAGLELKEVATLPEGKADSLIDELEKEQKDDSLS